MSRSSIQQQSRVPGSAHLSVSRTLRARPPGLRRPDENLRLPVARYAPLRQIPAG